MNLHNWLMLAHVLGAMVWLGGGLMQVLFALRARASGDAAVIADFARSIWFTNTRVIVPALFVVVVTGVWMVLEGAEWNLSQPWVLVGLGLWVVAFIAGGSERFTLTKLTRADEGAEGNARVLLGRWITGTGIVLAVLLVAA